MTTQSILHTEVFVKDEGRKTKIELIENPKDKTNSVTIEGLRSVSPIVVWE